MEKNEMPIVGWISRAFFSILPFRAQSWWQWRQARKELAPIRAEFESKIAEVQRQGSVNDSAWLKHEYWRRYSEVTDWLQEKDSEYLIRKAARFDILLADFSPDHETCWEKGYPTGEYLRPA